VPIISGTLEEAPTVSEERPMKSTSGEEHHHDFKHEFSAESPYCGAMVMRNGGGDTCGLFRYHPLHLKKGTDDPHQSHVDNCWVRKRPPQYYELGNPDSEQHCSSCHCSCDPEGPRCGHWAGCPGC
jgi:hypothetical protein